MCWITQTLDRRGWYIYGLIHMGDPCYHYMNEDGKWQKEIVFFDTKEAAEEIVALYVLIQAA